MGSIKLNEIFSPMTIYKIEDYLNEKKETTHPISLTEQIRGFSKRKPKSSFFSSFAARFLFVLLLIADIIWGVVSILLTFVKVILNCTTLFMIDSLKDSMRKSWQAVVRSLACMLALIIAIFAPSLGIMFACLYFLMYDKNGVEEVVPSSLRDQFQDFFPR
jgi:uncharacterized membrane protein